jgi:hypothetical protein
VLELVQIAKLSMIPVSCLFEVVFDKIGYSRDTKLSIMVVLAGVAICTVSDVSVNTKGFVAAVVAVWSTAMQQYVWGLNPTDHICITYLHETVQSLLHIGPIVGYFCFVLFFLMVFMIS